MTSPKHFMDNRPTLTNENYVPEDEYAKQRKCRMQDAIDDYLNDEKVSSRRVYEEMLSCIDDVINYHKSALDRATGLKELMHGHREIDDVSSWESDLQYISQNLPDRY